MAARVRFGVYELDRDAMELRRHGLLIRLQEQPCRVLAVLAERPGELITREELREKIWGDTFVDFDRSLNKAVNRIREALNDNAATPQYVETVPRRGYRFIAAVAADPQLEAPGPILPVGQDSVDPPAQPGSTRLLSKLAVIATVTVAIVAVIALAALAWLRGPAKATPHDPRHMAFFAGYPVLSRDGKLLAYSHRDDGGILHMWVQQTTGGQALQVTRVSASQQSSDFSPDGAHIAFVSDRNGGELYITPTLPGEPRLLSAGNIRFPRFSPSGDRILYGQDEKAYTVPVDGGVATSLPLNQEFRLAGPSLWSPDGNSILFYGARVRDQSTPPDWWMVPLQGGKAQEVQLPEVSNNYQPLAAVRAWIKTPDSHEWIVYSTASLESWKLWRIRISSQGVTENTPELLYAGSGALGPGGSVSTDGKLAYWLWTNNASIYEIPINDRGQKQGATFELPLAEGGEHTSPSVSRDGRWMAYDSNNFGKPNTIVLRDLTSGTEHTVDDRDRRAGDFYETSISPDGSTVFFERDCIPGSLPANSGSPMSCSFMVVAASGAPKQVCEHCTVRGLSSDGSVALLQKYDLQDVNKDRIVLLDLPTKEEKDFLSLPDRPLFHPFFSWDDHWVVFKKSSATDLSPSQILIAPVRHGSAAGPESWIAATEGRDYADKPQFSADGNTLFFTSTRDGYLCIWAQRLNPRTKHPVGPAFAFEHFHNAEGRDAAMIGPGAEDLTVARDKMLINLPRATAEVWLTQIQ